MFDDVVVLTAAEYDAYVIACLETKFGADYPDAAGFVIDEHQRLLDSRARLLSSGAAHLERAVAADREASRAAARRARALAAFARSRPAGMFDRAPGERGAAAAASIAARPDALTEVSEWAVDEAAATLGVSGRTASLMLVEAVTLVEGLPATLAALSAGDISPAHARALVEIAGPVSTADKRAAVEAAVLSRAARQTVAALRACARRAVLRIDAAAAADRLARAVADRQVRLDAREDGMSALTVLWATPVGRACYEALSAYAKACEFDDEGARDPRTHQQRMADCLTDLILRPHADRPAVHLALTLVAGVDTLTGHGPGADEPGEVDGDLVPAALVRELAYTLGLLPRPAAEPASVPDPATTPEPATASEPATLRKTRDQDTRDQDTRDQDTRDQDTRDQCHVTDGPGTAEHIAAFQAAELAAAHQLRAARTAIDRLGREHGVDRAQVASDTADAAAHAQAREALTRLLDARRLIDTALAQRPRIAVTDRLTGALLALTDSAELRTVTAAGRGLGPPSGTVAHDPTEPLYRFVMLRDRRCRFPGCRARARCCDLDHQIPHPHGPTTHDNLACLCKHHHRLSHQALGWRLHRNPDGGLVWTLPSGRVLTTEPPAFGTDDGSTPPVAPSPRTGRESYADALAALANPRPVPPDLAVRVPF